MLVLNMMSNSGSKIKILICCTKRGVVLHCCHLCVWLSMALNSNSFSSWSSKGKWKGIRLNWDKSDERETMKQRISRSWVNCHLVCQSVGRSVNEAFNLSDIQLLSQSESQLLNQPRRWNLTNRIIQQPANRREQQMYWIVFNQWINRSSSSLSPVRSINQLAFVKEQITKKEKKNKKLSTV